MTTEVPCIWSHNAPRVIVNATRCGNCGYEAKGLTTWGTFYPLPFLACRECAHGGGAKCGKCREEMVLLNVEAAV